MAKKPFSLTYVVYDEEDGIIGWLMALTSLSPVFVIVSLCTCVLVHRDMHSVFLLLGMISCTILNIILKRIIRQPRPMQGGVQVTYGMPSSHSQFMTCFAIYITLWLWNKVSFTHSFQCYLFICAIWILCFFVLYSRLYLQEHTLAQVFVGIVIGLVYGIFLYWLNEKYCRRLYSQIANLSIFKWFDFKDYSTISNVLNEEWKLAETFSKACLKEE